MRPAALSTLIALAAAAQPTRGEACSAPPCLEQGELLPVGEVPANLGALLYRSNSRLGLPEGFEAPVLVSSDGTRLPLTVEGGSAEDALLRLLPGAALVPGERYNLEHTSACGPLADLPALGPFSVTAPAPLPTQLGQLQVTRWARGPLRLAASARCSREVEVSFVDVELTLAAEAEPWREALVFETWVDGRRWDPRAVALDRLPFGSSWLGRGIDRLYVRCEPDASELYEPGLSAGPHEVELRATLPGTDVVLRTAPIALTLDCAADPATDGDPNALDPGGLATDDGCGCRSTGDQRAGLALLLLLALARARQRR